MSQSLTAECCPRFDPKPWDEVTLDLRGRLFRERPRVQFPFTFR